MIRVAQGEELAEAARIAREKKDHLARIRKPQIPANKRQVAVHCPCGTVKYFAPSNARGRKYCCQDCRVKYYHGPGRGQKYVFDDEIDAQIRDVYLNEVGKSKQPVVKLLAEKLGIPPWRIKRRAVVLDVVPVCRTRKKQPRWTDPEKDIVRDNITFTIENIRRKLAAAGFTRSINAIKTHITRTAGNKPRENYSGNELAKFFGLDPHSISLWIRKGYLRAERRGTHRTGANGGDIWDIRPEDVRQFIIEHVEILDFRKLDRWWLVELLTRQGA